MAPPTTIGPYQIVRELGRGGMGAVYEVYDPRLDRRLALKLNLSDEPASEARFLREAELLARVQHPGVVAIHDQGRTPQGPYLVTDLVPGEELRARHRGRPAAPEEAARLVRDLADAVEAVHQAGILHRDLKPANVIVLPDGRPILLDFGVARDQTGEALTRTGTTVGTAAYMSPEQAGGISPRQLNARTDVYGLGSILLFLLTGEAPFASISGVMALIKAVMLDEPEWPADAPPALDGILRKAMAKERLDRYVSAAALRDDLDRYLRGEQPEAPARAAPRASRPKLALAVGAVLGLAGVAGAGWYATRPSSSSDPQVDTAADALSTTVDRSETKAPAPSPTPTPGAGLLRLFHDYGDPAGHRVAFLPSGRLVTAGKDPQRSGNRVVLWSTSWTPERTWPVGGSVDALATAKGAIFLATSRRRGKPMRLLRLDPRRSEVETILADTGGVVSELAVSPTGREVALAIESAPSPEGWVVRVADLERAGTSRVSRGHDARVFDVDWQDGVIVSCSGKDNDMGLPVGRSYEWNANQLAEPGWSVKVTLGQAQAVTLLDDRRYAIGTTGWFIHVQPINRDDLVDPLPGVKTGSARGGFGAKGSHNGSVRDLVWAGDGRLYSLSGEGSAEKIAAGQNEVRAWDLRGTTGRTLGGVIHIPRESRYLALSPDKTHLAVAYLRHPAESRSFVELYPVALLTDGLKRYDALPQR